MKGDYRLQITNCRFQIINIVMNIKSKIGLYSLLLLMLACGKKTDVNGTVFSKHQIPSPNIKVQLEVYTG